MRPELKLELEFEIELETEEPGVLTSFLEADGFYNKMFIE